MNTLLSMLRRLILLLFRSANILGKLNSIVTSKIRGSKVSKEAESLLRKFAQQVEKIFKTMPNLLEWRSFYRHDLPILMDICEEVRKVSIQNDLNRSQIRALETLKEVSSEEFKRVTAHDGKFPNPVMEPEFKDFPQIELKDLSAWPVGLTPLGRRAGVQPAVLELWYGRSAGYTAGDLTLFKLNTGESYTSRLAITGSRQIYLPVEIQQMLKSAGKVRIWILGGWGCEWSNITKKPGASCSTSGFQFLMALFVVPKKVIIRTCSTLFSISTIQLQMNAPVFHDEQNQTLRLSSNYSCKFS